MYGRPIDSIGFVAGFDPELASMMDAELLRQQDGLELIASENFASPAVIAAMGSILTNKYAEGLPGKRYYGGCHFVDEIEQLCIDRAKACFGAEFANVQPHSGAQANMAAAKPAGQLDIYVDGTLCETENVVLGITEYEVTVDAKVGQVIRAVISGTQDLPRGVYFYAPRPSDLDGDGIATSREVSQNLIGVSSGETEIYADAEVTVPNVTELTVNKTWNDGDDRDGIRPDDVTVRLMADGTEVDHVILSAENNWTWTFKNIPVVNESGTVISYTI